MKKTRKYYLKGMIVLLSLLFLGCYSDAFERNALEISRVLQNARELLVPMGLEESLDRDGEKVYIGTNNTEKTKEYLESKDKELRRSYELIKRHFSEETENSTDALFILALTNEVTCLFTGSAIEDRCAYAKRIGKEKPSTWVVDHVFGPILCELGHLDAWVKKSISEKYSEIYDLFYFSCAPGSRQD